MGGHKSDAAQITVGTTRSTIAYVKGVLDVLVTHDTALGAILNALGVVDAFHDVPTADVVTNAQIRDVVGNKGDTPILSPSATASLMAYVKGVISTIGAPSIDYVGSVYASQVGGHKSDAAQTTVGTTRSTIAYVKGLLNQVASVLSDTETLFARETKTITLGTGAVPVTETLFTVTGEVEVIVSAFIDVAPTAAAVLSLEVGIAGATDGLISATTKGNLLINNLWVGSPAAKLVTRPAKMIIGDGSDIAHIIKDSDATAGIITYYCWWRALSADGNVVAV